MVFVRATLIVLFVMVSGVNLAAAAPLAIEGGQQVSKGASAEKAAVTLPDKSVAVVQVERTTGSVAGNDITFPPALLLFILALSAIFWLGRHRNRDDFVEE